MSSQTLPISPSAFASALQDLPLSTLHLKAAELRNSIAHLDYSNEQLKPFADGTDPSLPRTREGAPAEPDQDCVDAIRENEIVIARMVERIALLKAEVEGRGCSWTEFSVPKEGEDLGEKEEVNGTLLNGTDGQSAGGEEETRSAAWTDGTFQTGRIVNGEVRMDGAGAGVVGNGTNGISASVNGTNGGGRLDDEALRRAMEERMRALATEDDGDDNEGMHL